MLLSSSEALISSVALNNYIQFVHVDKYHGSVVKMTAIKVKPFPVAVRFCSFSSWNMTACYVRVYNAINFFTDV